MIVFDQFLNIKDKINYKIYDYGFGMSSGFLFNFYSCILLGYYLNICLDICSHKMGIKNSLN